MATWTSSKPPETTTYAWEAIAGGVTKVPGWPVCAIFDPVPTDGTCVEKPDPNIHTHDSKIVPTPAIVDINGDGHPDVLAGLVDTTYNPIAAIGSMKITGYMEAFASTGSTPATPSGEMAGWPVAIPGLEQGYGVAQDFVTQGTESPVVYDGATGPQAVVNDNLFFPVRVDLHSRGVSAPFASLGLGLAGPVVPTTSPSLGKIAGGTVPLVVQGLRRGGRRPW